ncbi:uncharacterized protein LOC117814521 [Xyrichtys novacula]|uniref:Uncharacterized protein LOC117814521 n=1 Tax=Xyrichtys novacula TaxID=13765 RepID=A0AAV1F5T1_XYRNO|nr:uncharacterized protein LOC117814521 [Xyrichtys novacula]
MALVYILIFLLSLMFRSCQFQCVKEMVHGSEFSINVTTHIKVRPGDCIRIPYEITLENKKVRAEHTMIWFRGDPENTVSSRLVRNAERRTTGVFNMDGLPHGEYEFGIRLEWGCNQTFIFPTTIRVSVSGLIQPPFVLVPMLTEGKTSRLRCLADTLCSAPTRITWTGTAVRKEWPPFDRYDWRPHHRGFPLTPTADDHNTNVTCVAEYENNIVSEKTVTLIVKFAPRFLNGSQCVVKRELLVCSCISWGNPPPPITWPVDSLTDFSIKSHSKAEIVNSTLTFNAAEFYNTSIKCVSSNEVGQRKIEIKIQNYTETSKNSVNPNTWQPCTALPWVTAVSVCLNLVLLISLIICIHKWCKRSKEKNSKEEDTYMALNRAQIETEYSVISPRRR